MVGPSDMPRVLEVVRSVVVDVSDGRGLGQLSPEVSFERELGLGSLERVELAVRAGEVFGVHLSEEAIATTDTPQQLLAQLHAAQSGRGASSASSPVPEGDRAALLPRDAPAPEPTEAKTLVEALEYHVRLQPDRVHILLHEDDGSTTPITYRQLHRSSMTVARALRSHGLEPGRSVAIMLPTGAGYFASFMGILLAGGVPVPLYPPIRLDRITEYIARCAKILANARAQMLITFERAARVAEIARDRVAAIEEVLAIDALLRAPGAEVDDPAGVRASVLPEHTALIQYTSGSTGDPKGVELTQANVMSNIRAARVGCELSARDVLISWLPLYHDMGLIGGWLMPFYFGIPTVLMSPLAFLSKPERWLLAMHEYRGTASVAPNFAFDLCVKRIDEAVLDDLDLSCVRSILNGSEPILPATLDRFIEKFGRTGLRREAIFCAYGLAENMVAVAFPPVLRAPRVDRIERAIFEAKGQAVPTEADEELLEFVGVGSAVQDHEIQVVDDAGDPLAERQQGTVWFRGPSSFKGYFGRPEATAEVQREGGWVDTGDLGYFAEGELFITGRVKDLIIKSGRNYYPHEIESAAGEVEGIRLGCVAAFALRNDKTGTEEIVVIAETRERDELSREMLRGRVLEAVTAKVGVPPDIIMLALPGAVPKTSSGKIRRGESRRIYLDGAIDRSHGSVARQAAGLYLHSLPRRATQLARRIGAAIYGIYAAAVILFFCILAPLVGRLCPAGLASRRLAVFESRAALGLSGLRPRVSGLERIPKGAAILVANHVGYLDFLICAATLPMGTRFVIKSELRDNWYVGPLLTRLGHVFIDRHSAARSLASLEEVVEILGAGDRVILFPEGTFSSDVGMRPFKLGAFRLACESEVPVIPVVIRGSRKALRDGTWLPRHERIEVEVLDPIAAGGREIADIVELRDRSAEAIAARLDEPRLYAADISLPGASDATG